MPRMSNHKPLILHILRVELGLGDGPATVPAAALVQAMALAPSSITGLLQAAGAAGLVDYTARHGARLTAHGREQAMRMLRRHRLVETYLQHALGLDWAEVHDEAERIDAAASDRLIERMAAVLGDPTEDPHGDPIPDRDGRIPAQRPCCRVASNPAADSDPIAGPVTRFPIGARVRLVHVVGHDPAFLRRLGDHGIVPGAAVAVVAVDPAGGTIALQAVSHATLVLGAAADQVHVERLTTA